MKYEEIFPADARSVFDSGGVHYLKIGRTTDVYVDFLKGNDSLVLPEYATMGSAGADVRALIPEPIVLAPLQRKLVPTGLFVAIPIGHEIQIRPRSGLAYKNGVTVLNSPGTIDSDYRGEIKVLLVNLSDTPFTIENGDRIAQLVVAQVPQIAWRGADELPDTYRGSGGFSSTGVK